MSPKKFIIAICSYLCYSSIENIKYSIETISLRYHVNTSIINSNYERYYHKKSMKIKVRWLLPIYKNEILIPFMDNMF